MPTPKRTRRSTALAVPEMNDLFGDGTPTPLPRQVRKLVEASHAIRETPPDRREYLQSTLCHVSLPRSQTNARVFERSSGAVSIRIEAGVLFLDGVWVDQPLPYGTKPRLAMIHVTTMAKLKNTREIPIFDSLNQFMLNLGLTNNGGQYDAFRDQMKALAACHMQLGRSDQEGSTTIKTSPISQFDAWRHPTDHQEKLWPGTLMLSEEFYAIIQESAVPLDPRALHSLQNSALALDIYAWLAERLRRVPSNQPLNLSWKNLKEQFGQEYSDPRNFKDTFTYTLRKVLTVYPEARVESVIGGLLLRSSPPPIPVSKVTNLKLPSEEFGKLPPPSSAKTQS